LFPDLLRALRRFFQAIESIRFLRQPLGRPGQGGYGDESNNKGALDFAHGDQLDDCLSA
jgi:hypothetical protein